MWLNNFWEWWERYSGFVVGPILVFVALVLRRFLIPIAPSNRLVDDLTIALFIAGILMTTVDPFVKRKARREATRDIFHHMLGYSLPETIRERLQQIVEQTKFYRRGTTLYMELSEEGESLALDIQMEFEVINPTRHALSFEPLLQFEEGEHAILRSITCFEVKHCLDFLSAPPALTVLCTEL